MEDKDDKNPPIISNVKIALIGNSAVGKSCIINRFTKGVFEENIKPTIGIGFAQKYLLIDGVNIQCNLWDTAGQEKYKSMGKECYRDAFIVCLVYDITDAKSFEDIEKVWLPDLKKFGEKYRVLALVGNKCDLYANEKVDESKAREYAEKIKASFFLSSAKNGDNIDILFENLVRKYLDPNFIIKVNLLKKERGGNICLKDGSDNKKAKKGSCC